MPNEERRTGFVLRDPLPWDDAVELVRTAERIGYEAVFVPEIEAREAFATLTGFGLSTERLRIGTGVVTVQTRSPLTTAMGAATVNELSRGRMVLGIGAGSPGPTGSSGASAGPLARVEEYVRVVRGALAGEVVGSKLFGVAGFRLGVRGANTPPPLWLGALGDKMLALAGRIGDGVILNWCTPARVAAARRIVAKAAEEAGRDPAAVTISVYVRACLDVDDDIALPPLQAMAGMYAAIPAYRRQMEQMGLAEDANAAAEAHRERRPGGVPESLVRALTVAGGGRADALARFDEYREAGADLILCYPVAVGDPASSVIRTVLAAAPQAAPER